MILANLVDEGRAFLQWPHAQRPSLSKLIGSFANSDKKLIRKALKIY